MSSNKISSSGGNLRSSLTQVSDPIDLELSEAAQDAFSPLDKSSSRDQLHEAGSSDIFCYGSAHGSDSDNDGPANGNGNGNGHYHHDQETMSLSDRFNEENVIDILANVDTDAIDEEHMVTHKEDDWTRTLAGIAGNVLEWYDFAVFGYFSDILGDVFFAPNQEGNAAIVESFAVFGGAFFMRPVGGAMMGYIGDKYGSRKALTISIFLMAFPTFAMGCLPGYDKVGSLAVVLLALVRMLQGLSVGGQLMSSLVFTLERHPKEKWGLYGSYVMAAANFGTLLGGFVATIIRSSLSDEALHAWGWRIPFLSGILVSVSGFYLKGHGEDDEAGHVHGDTSSSEANPIRLAFSRANIRPLLASSMVPLLWSSGFYLTFVWMPIYMSDLIDTPVPNSFAVNSASLGVSVCLLFSGAGWLSDKVGRKRVMAVGGIALALSAPLALRMISSGDPVSAFFAQTFLGISLSFWGAPMMAWLAESFEPAARLTSVSIGYNIAQACGGGIAPAIATVMVDSIGPEAPAYYLTIIACIALVGLLFVAPKKAVHFTALQGDDEDDFRSSQRSDSSNTTFGDRELT